MAKKKLRLDDAPGFAIGKTARLLGIELGRVLRGQGANLTPEQCGILCRLWEQDGRTLGEIAQSTYKDTASVTRMVDGLEKKGLVERRPDPSDRRARRVHLTMEGAVLEDRLVPVVSKFGRGVFSCLSEEERRVLVGLLGRLCDRASALGQGQENPEKKDTPE